MADPKNILKDEFISLPKPFVYADRHVYDVMKLIADLKITTVPILNRQNQYIGCTDLLYLMSQITAVGSIKETGGILVLKMGMHDYSLTEISRIVEENNAKILSSYVSSKPDSIEIEVTLKINSTELDRIIRTFERYDYLISETYVKGNHVEGLKKRYDELMNYLNM